MSALTTDIAAFERMRARLEIRYDRQWVVFFGGAFVGAYPDFQSAAEDALKRYDTGPYLIRQVGAPPVQLPGGMVFTPAQAIGPSGL